MTSQNAHLESVADTAHAQREQLARSRRSLPASRLNCLQLLRAGYLSEDNVDITSLLTTRKHTCERCRCESRVLEVWLHCDVISGSRRKLREK